MNQAQIHLLFNHWPLILIVVGFFVLLVGEWRGNMSYKQLGLILFIAAALFAIPTWLSGEGAEHILMEQDLASHEIIERHEGFGFWAAMLSFGIGIFSLVSLIMIYNVHAFFGYLRKFVLFASACAIVLIAIAAHTGGEIRHTEIRKTESK